METKVLKPNKMNIKLAAKLINNGEIIGFPTETVYGLGADAFNESAVKKIFQAKNRPSDNPLIVHIQDTSQLVELTYELTELEKRIINSFWPGPLSIVLKSKEKVPKVVTAGLDTIAVRLPAHPVAKEIIKEAKVPIAAPSANISGKPSATSAQHVFNDFESKIPLIIDGGKSDFGLESSVIRVLEGQIVILRPGAITREMLSKIAPTTLSKNHEDTTPASPGIKHPHYHPNAKIILVKGMNYEEISNKVKKINNPNRRQAFFGFEKISSSDNFFKYSEVKGDNRLYDYAQNLYSFFRDCDQLGVDEIIIHQVPLIGLGHAIMNRIEKASDEIF
ncbi:MAG: L-threonylcarbamoyladenylate synthase [Clostridia bacterium]